MRTKNILNEKDKILKQLNSMQGLVTGRIDIFYCNNFINEAIELLKNAVALFEDGYFDCAFYSIRQAYETANTMLFLANGENKDLTRWLRKERFPQCSKIIELLDSDKVHYMSNAYSEVRMVIPEFFEESDKYWKMANKLIHKQGFDTFYTLRNSFNPDINLINEKDTELFYSYIRNTIGAILLLFIILEPLSLALTDEDVYMRTHFDSMTEPIYFEYYDDCLSLQYVEKIKETEFYQEYIEQFLANEKMNVYTASVIKEQYFDVAHLEEIKNQAHLLCGLQRFELEVLLKGLKISRFYVDMPFLWDFTSYESKNDNWSFSSNEFDCYKNVVQYYNQVYRNVYITYVKIMGSDVFLEHNEKLTEEEIRDLNWEVDKFNEDYQKLEDVFKKLMVKKE